MKKILGLLFILSIAACSSLPTKEVQLAKSELDKAKASEGPVLAEKDYKDAEQSYQSAEGFLQKKEGDKAKDESVKSLEKSRTAILTSKDKKTSEAIEKVEKMIADLKKQYGIDDQFKADADLSDEAKRKLEVVQRIKPAEDLLSEAKKLQQDGKNLMPAIQKNLKNTESVKEIDQFIELMDKSYAKAKEAEKILDAEYEKLRKIQELNSMITKGDEMVTALQKDAFVAQFYAEDRDKLIADYQVLKKVIQDKNEAEIEKNKGAYKNLADFFDKMSAEKLALNNGYRQITDKMLAKIKGFYKQDAESYLEKATRLREEVYKAYGKNIPAGVQQVKPQQIQNKAQIIEFKASRIEQQADEEKVEINKTDEDQIKQEVQPKEEVKAEEKKEEVKKEETQTEEKKAAVEETKKQESQEAVKEEVKTEEKKAVEEKQAEKKEETKEQPSGNPEQMLLNKMENLYNDAEALFAKEDYSDSIEKAKETIDLAQKMLALKKKMDGQTSQKQSDDTGFNSQEIYGSLKVDFKKYTIKKGDCLWKIAMLRKLYGKAYLWPFIWYANKNKIKDPDKIKPNTEIQVPIFKQ